jgi:hypothetical protein
LQAASQQNPSTQWLEAHWSSALHAAACGFCGTHAWLASQ